MKNYLSQLKLLILSFINNFPSLLIFIKNIKNEDIYSVDSHIQMASNWLLNAQNFGNDDGYSRGFYLFKKNGWDKSYIETTGYIIPTLLNVYSETGNEKYKESALLAGLWLLDIQKENGAYYEIDDGKELVFDTGQVLYGLIAVYESNHIGVALKERYKKAIDLSSNWLCSVQDDDDSWSTLGYYGMPHSYYSRVSSILYKAGNLLDNNYYKRCATNHVKWVLSNQEENGFFRNLNFTPDENKYILHSMIYVLEGLLDYYIYTNNNDVLKALLRNADILKDINSTQSILLCSQYDIYFNCKNGERCITGLAQWSNIAFKLYKLTGDNDYLLCARKTIYYLKSKQFKRGKHLKGSLPGSIPFTGFYAKYSAINWGVKFYIDALLESKKYYLSELDESRLWIGECFKFEKEVVNNDFSYPARKYISILNDYIPKSSSVLDLGCGKGRYLEYFNDKFKNIEFYGIDPVFKGGKIKNGDAYNINLDKKFDLIYTIEVLQHLKYIDQGLKEISDKLTDGGLLIICDRSTNSLKGYIKILLEFSGKWMYSFDGPFSEKWYSTKKWREILPNNGFKVEKIISFTNKSGRLGWINRYNIIITRKLT